MTLKRAEERLSKALKKHAEHEATFARCECRTRPFGMGGAPRSWRLPHGRHRGPASAAAGLWRVRAGRSTLAAAEEEEQGEEEQGAADEKQADEPEAPAPAASPRAFVLDFPGDVQASGVAALRQEVTAIVGSADASRGDRVVVRLESGGGP